MTESGQPDNQGYARYHLRHQSSQQPMPVYHCQLYQDLDISSEDIRGTLLPNPNNRFYQRKCIAGKVFHLAARLHKHERLYPILLIHPCFRRESDCK